MREYLARVGMAPVIVIIVLLVLVLILLFTMIRMNMRIGRLETRYKFFMKGADGQTLEKNFAKKFYQIDRMYEVKQENEKDITFLKKNYQHLFSKYGVEKYDAFEDVGGKLSFALALLDNDNTGLILNAVHSRDNCFLYLKEIFKGESYVMLSQEEVEALRCAVNFGLQIEKDAEAEVKEKESSKEKEAKKVVE